MTPSPEEDVVKRLERDMWFGDGRKSGICTRMEVAEGRIEGVTERLNSIDKKTWALILLGLTILGTDVASLLKDTARQSAPQYHSFTE